MRRKMESTMWHHFRQGLHGAERRNRTLTGQRPKQSSLSRNALPKVRPVGRPKKARVNPLVVGHETLVSVLEQDPKSLQAVSNM